MTADVQRELAEALADELAGWPIGSGYYATTVGTDDAREMVEKLLPLIAAAEKRAAAAALREAAAELHVDPLLRAADYASYVAGKIRDHAAALDPAGAGDEAAR